MDWLPNANAIKIKSIITTQTRAREWVAARACDRDLRATTATVEGTVEVRSTERQSAWNLKSLTARLVRLRSCQPRWLVFAFHSCQSCGLLPRINIHPCYR